MDVLVLATGTIRAIGAMVATVSIIYFLAGRRGGRLLAVLLHDGLLANIVFR